MTNKVIDAQADDRARLEEERAALKSSPKQQPISAVPNASAEPDSKSMAAPENKAVAAPVASKRKGK